MSWGASEQAENMADGFRRIQELLADALDGRKWDLVAEALAAADLALVDYEDFADAS